jgi:hypothetical protein
MRSDHKTCTQCSNKARTKRKQQQQLQITNSLVEASKSPEGTALLAGKQFHCLSIKIIIRSAARAHKTAIQEATTSPCTAATNCVKNEKKNPLQQANSQG